MPDPDDHVHVAREQQLRNTGSYGDTHCWRRRCAAAVEFTAHATQVNKGQCTVLHWRALDVTRYIVNNGGVAGESSQQVCPEVTTPYSCASSTTMAPR